eukprot:Gb_09218 [translate_table: standard]
MDKELYMAALLGNVDWLRSLPDDDNTRRDIVCQVTPQGNTALHLAARRGHHQFVSELLKLKPCILFARNFKQETALHAAGRWGRTKVVEVLLKSDENNVVCTCGSCVLSSELDLEEYQVDRQFWRAQTNSENTALHYAAKGGHPDVIQLLLSKDENLASLVNEAGESALFTACEEGHMSTVQQLLEKVPCISDKRHDGRTSLQAAILRKRLDVAKELLNKRGLELAKQADNSSTTALHLATSGGHLELVKRLLELDRELCYTVNGEGMCAIHIAAQKRYFKTMRALVDSNPDCVELIDKDGKTVLHLLLDRYASFPSSRVNRFVAYLHKRFDVSYLLNESDNERNAVFHRATKTAFFSVRTEAFFRTLAKARFRARINFLSNARDVSSHESKVEASCEIKTTHKDSVNTLILVATLLATITSAAAFTMPGGINSEGSPVLINRPSFKIFVIASTVAMFLSMGAVSLLSLPWLSTVGSNTVARLVLSGARLLSWALLATQSTFIVAIYTVVAPRCLWLAITVCVIGCGIQLYFAFTKFRGVSRPMINMIKMITGQKKLMCVAIRFFRVDLAVGSTMVKGIKVDV